MQIEDSSVWLPFDPVQVVDNLRYERYLNIPGHNGRARPAGEKALKALYYAARPALGVSVRKHIQRAYFSGRMKAPFPKWPVDVNVERILEQLLILAMTSRGIERLPFIWFWPQGRPNCATISHDVETSAGLDFCPTLMDLNDSFGIKTSFQIVPEERYKVPTSLLQSIRDRGFEINVHDLNHDGHLFDDHEQFMRRAVRINEYARHYRASGFRSAVMYRNADWLHALDFSYDMSIPSVAHLDPQNGGCCTVMPFFIGGIVELPVTTTQDYSLFHILKDYSTHLWSEQISRIRQKHGLVNIIVHPDYIIEESARRVYRELLGIIHELRASGETWVAAPGEVAAWWRLRSKLELVGTGDSCEIRGEGCETASRAYAVLKNGRLFYELENGTCEAS